ncbi:NADPH:quinone reductase [Ktedonobacter racemifer]|uniref:Alcohol dehydrogenase zinc-binding domain protein n=1 Tax=Ktedonobacter racemifer DSM 44963 TaxID=485913 RepID=D6TUK8_KTERA|nr:NADPH:quinone reductase [Ktedonobacter racemifer]EFH84076.1 Alcohol dehydrogenase zinc-binding domain protein [Ktedonobacter racemifer DSM 44963]
MASQKTMKAAYIDRPGGADKIIYGDLPIPTPGPRDILVKVVAVTVNTVDIYIRGGVFQTPLPQPFIIGRDVTGIVVEVGEEVSLFHPGERVWANNQGYDGRQGTFAEYVSIHECLLYHLPPNVDLHESVTVLHSGLTAIIGLFNKAQIRDKECIFVNGGDGSVGTAIIQLARAMGAQIIVTSGNEQKARWCEELGADLVINYKTQNVNLALKHFAPQGVNVYWDATPQPDIECALNAIAQRGRIIFMSGPLHQTTLMVGPFYMKNCTLYGFTVTDATIDELHTCASQIDYWLGRGVLKGRTALKLPLSQAAAAHRIYETQSLSGKIVLSPDWD